MRALRPVVALALVPLALLTACSDDDTASEALRPIAWNAGFAHGFELVRRESPSAVDADLDLMAATGARWLRVSIGWGHIERTPATYDWAGTDDVVRGARDRGLSVVAVVTTAPSWDSLPGCEGYECAPRNPVLYADFARVATQRYAPLGVHHWEIWNEPNHVPFWGPRPDPVAYTELLRQASVAIHDVDPSATVITGGLSPAPDDGREISPVNFLGAYTSWAAAPTSMPSPITRTNTPSDRRSLIPRTHSSRPSGSTS